MSRWKVVAFYWQWDPEKSEFMYSSELYYGKFRGTVTTGEKERKGWIAVTWNGWPSWLLQQEENGKNRTQGASGAYSLTVDRQYKYRMTAQFSFLR